MSKQTHTLIVIFCLVGVLLSIGIVMFVDFVYAARKTELKNTISDRIFKNNKDKGKTNCTITDSRQRRLNKFINGVIKSMRTVVTDTLEKVKKAMKVYDQHRPFIECNISVPENDLKLICGEKYAGHEHPVYSFNQNDNTILIRKTATYIAYASFDTIPASQHIDSVSSNNKIDFKFDNEGISKKFMRAREVYRDYENGKVSYKRTGTFQFNAGHIISIGAEGMVVEGKFGLYVV